jgi:hypothetical protein
MDCIWLGRKLIKIRNIFYRRRTIRIPDHDHYADWGPWWTVNMTFWEADHIVPVCEGGGCCGLENYQTLCLKCHKEETKNLAKRRANK